jgi:hypothetical protein
MKTFKLSIPSDILTKLKEIKESLPNFNVYLGGGYLRDLYSNQILNKGLSCRNLRYKTPKDVDIFLTPKESSGLIEVPIGVCSGFYINYHKDASTISDMEDRGVHSLTGMFNSKLSTSEWQLITYKNKVTQDFLCDDMDIGINQVMYDGNEEGLCVASANFVNDHENKEITLYHTYAKDRMYDRVVRMENKFRGYTATNKPVYKEEDSILRPYRAGVKSSVDVN